METFESPCWSNKGEQLIGGPSHRNKGDTKGQHGPKKLEFEHGDIESEQATLDGNNKQQFGDFFSQAEQGTSRIYILHSTVCKELESGTINDNESQPALSFVMVALRGSIRHPEKPAARIRRMERSEHGIERAAPRQGHHLIAAAAGAAAAALEQPSMRRGVVVSNSSLSFPPFPVSGIRDKRMAPESANRDDDKLHSRLIYGGHDRVYCPASQGVCEIGNASKAEDSVTGYQS